MRTEQPTTLQFPALLHGPPDAVTRKAKAEGRRCARQYEKTGSYPLPRELHEVKPGELVIIHNLADFFTTFDRPAWRLYPFIELVSSATDGLYGEAWEQRDEAFEAFCRNTPWGALYHAVEPSARWSASRMAARLGAVLSFWAPLQVPRYLYLEVGVFYTLEELMREIYGRTMEAWCHQGATPVREHMEATVERMVQASKEDCIEAIVRVVPSILARNPKLTHREVLGDPDALRDHLSALPLDRFERFSSAVPYAVNEQLVAWVHELNTH